MNRILCVSLFILISIQSVFSKEIDLSSIKNGRFIDASEMQILQDSSMSLRFEDIQNSADFKFHKSIETVKDVNSNYWIKFKIKNDATKKWVLEIVSLHTENIFFFQPKYSGYNIIETGHLSEKTTRPYLHKNFIFDLNNSNYSKYFYLKIHSNNKVAFLFKIQNQQHFTSYSTQEYLVLGIYYGMLLLLIIYHLIIFAVIRHKLYFFYSCTVLLAGLISASDDGFGVLYIWNDHREISQYLGLYILPTSFLIFFSIYSISFLGNVYEQGRKIITYTLLSYLGLYGIQLIITNEKVYFPLLYSVPFLAIYAVFLYTYIKTKYKPLLYFLLGFSFSLFGLIVNQLRLLDIVEGNMFTVYAFNVGVILEFLSLALSISYRYKEERRLKRIAQLSEITSIKEKQLAQEKMYQAVSEKEKVTQEINKALEIRVNDRTTQLNDLIQKLRNLNFEYDKENWDLKRSVKTELYSKLRQERITLQQIVELYPSNYKCFEYLSEVKWSGNAYECPKCGYSKFSVNKDTFARKCSKCSSSNSVTKDSLFQAQKLPLNKLFYITYLFQTGDKINVTKLSEELKISEVSLYKFLSKIKAKNKLLNKSKSEIKSWVDLIY